jgi:hypothetical protein
VGTNLSIDGTGVLSATLSGGSITGTVAVANGGTGATTLTGYVKGTGTTAMTASATIPVADVTGAAPLASPTFTGTLTAPIYASTPQALTDGTTISWDPSLGLNASVILGGNRTLSFTTTPTAGAYGTLVVTQDGAGSRSLTLPSTTNKVLGSTSTTTIALSAAAGAKDIINFYYDGTNCYWNVGQGYGTAATVATTNLASSVSGTLAVANGGTGQTSIAGIQSTLGLAGTKVAIGATAGGSTQGSGAIAIGNSSGNLNQGSQSVAIGYVAGASNQGLNSVAIGSNAAQSGQGTQSVAIGLAANSAANNATALGANASAGHTNATAIGYQAATTATNTIQLGADGVTVVGSTAVTNVKTSGTLTAGTVTYPNTHAVTSGQVLTSSGSGTLTWTTPASSGSSTYTVGSNPSLGGYVFYVTPNGLHGLVAETFEWNDAQYTALDKLKDPAYHSTAGKEFMDWRVPTIYELNLMYTMKAALNMNTNTYWSSTINASYNALYPYNKRFSDGVQYDNNMIEIRFIRAVRSF